MANTDAAFGLRPVSHRNGAPYNGAYRTYIVPSSDATALFVGDPVVITGTSNSSETFGFPPGTLSEVARANVAGPITGVVVGVKADTRESSPSRAASTQRLIEVADDPDLLFEVQADGVLNAADVGLNANLINTNAGSTITNLSGAELDTGTTTAPATTAGLALKIISLKPDVENDLASANSVALVSINDHTFANGVAGI